MSFGWLLLINALIGMAMHIAFALIVDDLGKRKFGEQIMKESDDNVHQRVMDTCMNSEKTYKIIMMITIAIAICAWEVAVPIIMCVTWKDYKELYKFRKGS